MYAAALALSVICFLGVTVYFVRSPAFSIFHPLTFYSAFHGFVFVFRPIVARLNDFSLIYRGYQFTPSASDKLTVILASNLGFLAFALFCLMSGNVAMQFKQDRFAVAERERFKPLLFWVLLLCVPIGLYSLASVWTGAATTGMGYESMIRDAGTGVYVNTKGNGYVAEAQLMLATCGALIAWLFRFRLLALMPLIGFVVLRAGTGGRGPFVTALVTVGLLYLYEHRRRLPSLQVAALLIAVVLAFNTVGNDRGLTIRKAIGNDTASTVFYNTRDNERWLEGMDFGNLEFFEYLVYAIPQRTHTYGYFLDNFQIFTEPIPRVLWKNKPVGAPFNRIYLMDYGRAIGMTRSLPGEGWYSLGWPGVLIWCGLWGYGLGLIYRRFVEGPQTTIKTAAYMIFVPIMIVAFRDGQLITVFREGLFFLGPVLLWYWLSRYAGIPSAVAMRAVARRKLKDGGANAAVPAAVPQADPEWAALPPAVRRRRATLRAAATPREA
ncbi:MAG: O-antigen polymerase [Novosphingobium sp.]